MLNLLNRDVVLILAVSSLAVLFFAPLAVLVIAISIRRSLARIADNLSRVAVVSEVFRKELDEMPAEHYDGSRPSVFNSMFGR